MAKVFIEETTLTKIGDAIRSKTGKTALIDPAVMDVEITNIPAGGGSDDIPELVLTGATAYAMTSPVAAAFVEAFPNKVTTEAISNASHMFYNSTLKAIPFEINCSTSGVPIACTQMFYGCTQLEHIPNLDFKATATTPAADSQSAFYNCYVLKNPPLISNIKPGNCKQFFYGCRNIRELPDNYFDSWNTNEIIANTYGGMNAFFSGCRSLRKVPTSFFEKFSNTAATSSSYNLYNDLFRDCYTLDEVLNVPVSTATLTSNVMSNVVSYCGLLSRFTFKTNEDGTPKTANWKSQTLDFTNFTGYSVTASYVTSYNSGITADKQVKDDATYQALKNDPDWFSTTTYYSKYTHDSAVETINSLPDTSAYLASAGGTNTIKFKKSVGSKTDGGAIENLTEEEIAVATAKGWTVTIS